MGKPGILVKVNLVRTVLQYYVKVPRSTCGLPSFFQNFHNAVGSDSKCRGLRFAARVGYRRWNIFTMKTYNNFAIASGVFTCFLRLLHCNAQLSASQRKQTLQALSKGIKITLSLFWSKMRLTMTEGIRLLFEEGKENSHLEKTWPAVLLDLVSKCQSPALMFSALSNETSVRKQRDGVVETTQTTGNDYLW